MRTSLALLLSYLIGSVPTAYLLVRYKLGTDIRQQGSGNVGATNAGRLLGRRYFVLILFLDGLKGVLGVVFGSVLIGGPWGGELGGLAAIIGHVAPIFLGFRGGKAVATSAGVFLLLTPVATAVALVVFLLVHKIFGVVSVGSMLSAVALVAACLVLRGASWAPAWAEPRQSTVILAGLACVLVLFLHRSNIVRLIRGEEH